MVLSWLAWGVLGTALWGMTLAQVDLTVAKSGWGVMGVGLAGVLVYLRRELHPGGWWGLGMAACFWGVGV